MAHDHLWNDLPLAERKRLAPHMIETHILHLTQARSMLVRNHVQQLREIDSWIKHCEASLHDEVGNVQQSQSEKDRA